METQHPERPRSGCGEPPPPSPLLRGLSEGGTWGVEGVTRVLGPGFQSQEAPSLYTELTMKEHDGWRAGEARDSRTQEVPPLGQAREPSLLQPQFADSASEACERDPKRSRACLC